MGVRRTRVVFEAQFGSYDRSADTSTRKTRELRQEVEKLAHGKYDAKLDVDTTEAGSRIRKLRADLAQFATAAADAKVDIDDAEAQAKLKRIQAQLLTLARTTADPDIDIEGLAKAEADLAVLQARLAKLDRSSTDHHVRVTGMAEVQKDASLLIDTVALLGPALIVAGATGGAAMVALAGSMAMGVGAAGTLASSFVGVGDALTALDELHKAEATNAEDQARAEVIASRQVRDARRGVEQTEMTVAQNIADARRALSSAEVAANQRVADAQRTLSRTRDDAAYAVEQAADRIEDANDAVADSARDVREAERGVTVAEKDLAAAHDEVGNALDGLHEARQEAVRDLQDMREAESDNALTVRSARLGLLRARQNLQETLRTEGHTWLDVREAQLAVAEAQDRLSDSRRDARRDRQDLTQAEKEGIKGHDSVIAAQEQVAQAHEGVSAAEEALRQSHNRLADAQDALRESRESLSEAHRDARRVESQNAQAIADAQRNLIRAMLDGDADMKASRRNLARAIASGDITIADANRQVRRALQDSNYQLGKNSTEMENLREAMEELSPAGRRFVRFIDDLRPKLDRLQDIAQENIFPGLQNGLEDVLTLMPEAEGIVDAYSRAWGQLAEEGGEALTSPFWRQYFDFLDQKAFGVTKRMGRAAGNLAGGFAGIHQAFFPLQHSVEEGILGWSRSFSKWGQNLRHSDRFEDFLGYVDRVGPQVFDVVGAIANAALEIGEAAAPIGEISLPVLKAIADLIAQVADSPLGTPLIGFALGLAAVNRSLRTFEAIGAAPVSRGIASINQRMRDGTQRAGLFRDGLRGLAGVGGMGLLLSATTQSNDELGTFMSILGGAATGFSVGGPWGAAIGGAAGLLVSLGDAFGFSGDEAKEARPEITNYTESLDELSGAATRSTRALIAQRLEQDGILAAAERLGIDTSLIVSAISGNEKAQRRLNRELDRAHNKWIAQRNVLVDAGLSYEEANERMPQTLTLIGDIRTATGQQTDALREQIEVRQREIDAIKGHAKTLTELSNRIVTNDEKARQLTKAIRQAENANYKATGQEKLHENQLEALGRRMGLTVDQVVRLIEKYKDVPPKVPTRVEFNDDDARRKTEAFVVFVGKQWDKLGRATVSAGFFGEKTTHVTGPGGLGHGSFAEGGYTGPGGKHEPAGVVHRDEFVVAKGPRRSLEMQAPGALDYMNRTGAWPGYADGGRVGAAQPTLHVDTDFSEMRQSVREFVKAVLSAGGRVGAALSWARKQVGDDYLLGGVGPDVWDCSGFMSGITNYLRGNPIHARIGSTADFPWPGFAPGVDPTGFTIGSTPSYPGSAYGHMAGTLGGVNVESSGGIGVRVGPSARGWNDSGFTQVYHLTGIPKGPVNRPGGDIGALSRDEKWIIRQEAGSLTNVTANNPTSTAFGLGQLLEANRIKFARQLGYNWGIERGDTGSTDRDRQIDMFRAYYRDRYGNAANARAFHQSHGWYDQGGPFPDNTMGVNTSGATEEVLTNAERTAFMELGRYAHMARVQAVSGSNGGSAAFSGELKGTFKIVNWQQGLVMFRGIAADTYEGQSQFDRSTARMG